MLLAACLLLLSCALAPSAAAADAPPNFSFIHCSPLPPPPLQNFSQPLNHSDPASPTFNQRLQLFDVCPRALPARYFRNTLSRSAPTPPAAQCCSMPAPKMRPTRSCTPFLHFFFVTSCVAPFLHFFFVTSCVAPFLHFFFVTSCVAPLPECCFVTCCTATQCPALRCCSLRRS
jgi:hypothetical protein